MLPMKRRGLSPSSSSSSDDSSDRDSQDDISVGGTYCGLFKSIFIFTLLLPFLIMLQSFLFTALLFTAVY